MTRIVEVLCRNNRILKLATDILNALSLVGKSTSTSDSLGTVIRSIQTNELLERWDQVILQLKRTQFHFFLLTGFDGIEEGVGGVVRPKRSSALPLAVIEDEDLADLLHVRDEKSSGTQSGTFTAGSWQTRTLNTVTTNEISGASLASDQITLPSGTYSIDAHADALRVDGHKAKLRDTTNSVDLIIGTSEFSDAGSTFSGNASFVRGRFTLSGTADLELQHWGTSTQSTNGFGTQTGTGEVEVYAEVLIKKIS